MIKRGLKRGFTLVELLVVVAILALLSGGAYIGIQRAQTRVMNERVVDDLMAITNALEQYRQDEGHYPNIADKPLKLGEDKNVNCFAADTTYAHDCTAAAFIQTQVDNILLTKRYLQEVPLDPRTKSRYMYGVTTDGQFFQVAGNYIQDDGTYISKVRGNVKKGYSLPSLLRSFNGPNFVMEGENYLPYSPDHLSLTASLFDLTPAPPSVNVTIDGAPANEGDVVQPDSIIETGPGSGVTVYFSDGSVTYLDEGTKLKILSNTQVDQNDEDGIITKIRLKLFSGKIWNKVARLASESEFNVETTSAIAGVRGTEWGIDDTNQLIVLSGTVVAREKYGNELSVATDDSVEFDSSDTNIFPSDKEVTGDGTFTNAQYTIPAHNVAMPLSGSLADQTAIEGKFYKGPFNNNYQPKILEIDTSVSNSEMIVFKYLEGVTQIRADDGTINQVLLTFSADGLKTKLTADLTQIMGMTQVKFLYVDKDGNTTGLTDPAMDIISNIILTDDDVYNEVVQDVSLSCDGTYSHHVISGPTTVIAGSTNSTYKVIATYAGPSCTQEVTKSCDWKMTPPSGPIGLDGKFHVNLNSAGTVQIDCDFNLKPAVNPLIANILSQTNSKCWGSDNTSGGSGSAEDKGWWDGAACWILAAAPNTSCDAACNSQVSAICKDASDPGGIDWDDDGGGNAICMKLASDLLPAPTASGGGGNNAAFAPYFLPGLNFCFERDNTILPPIVPNLCSNTVNMGGHQRICRCI